MLGIKLLHVSIGGPGCAAQDKTHQYVIRNSTTGIYNRRSQIFSESASFLCDHLHVLCFSHKDNVVNVYLFYALRPLPEMVPILQMTFQNVFLL